MPAPERAKANNALGAACISLLFLLETTELDHAQPNPATPWVRGTLALAFIGSVVRFLYFRRKARVEGPAP